MIQEAYDNLKLLTNGNVEQYEEARENFGKALLRYVKAIVATEYGSQFRFLEEAIGESIIKVLTDLPTFNANLSPLPVWIKTITLNICIDILRNHNNSRTQAYIGNEGHSPFANVDKLALHNLIGKLSKDDRDLILLRLKGLNDVQIAEKLGITKQAVGQRMTTIEKRLRTLGGGYETTGN